MSPPSLPSTSTPGSLSYAQSSGPAELIRTVPSTSSSELSILSADDGAERNGGIESDQTGKKVRKRPRESKLEAVPVKKAKMAAEGEEVKPKGIYCHQCHNRCEPDRYIRCTKLKQFTKHTPLRPCNLAWCDKDLARRYEVDGNTLRARRGNKADGSKEHDSSLGYIFTCPCCVDVCQNSLCRKKKGLEPLGAVKPAGQAVMNGNVSLKKIPTGQAKARSTPLNSSTLPMESDSELSELSSDRNNRTSQKKKPKPSSDDTNTPTKKAKQGSRGMASVGTNGKGKSANGKKHKAQNGDTESRKGKSAGDQGKGKSREGKANGGVQGKSKEKMEAKPKKVELPVEPPEFEKVDTRLNLDEADQRMALREYLNRFRPVLSIPERLLSAVDDFDRALTEASVRLFAGAMLDLIKEEIVQQHGDEELIELMSHHREELRYYADLARFATIYNTLAIPLGLRPPIPLVRTNRRLDPDANAIRALLTSDDTPIEAGPSRRTAASRIPHPSEVIRMLLALADRTIHTATLRYDLESTTAENEARRRHANEHKKDLATWEGKKKKLGDARVQCKTPAETKANKESYNKEMREHSLRMALANVNLRAALGRRAVRHEPLGVDMDGRIYYSLNPRPIDDDARAPIGWASGLLVWGSGVSATEGVEDIPAVVERWTHFGKSASVKQLAKWIEWRVKKAAQEARPAKSPGKAKPKPTPSKSTSSTQFTSVHPAAKVQSKLFTAKPVATPGRKAAFEIVIPISGRKALSSGSSLTHVEDSSDGESDISELSTPPETTEDLLRLMDPVGYKPSAEAIEEESKELVRRLGEVAEWLEVLEWKGLGEI